MKKKMLVLALFVVMVLQSACSNVVVGETWICGSCGKLSSGNFCNNCGAAKPETENTASSGSAVSSSSAVSSDSVVSSDPAVSSKPETSDENGVTSYVFLKDDGSLWYTPKNSEKPVWLADGLSMEIRDTVVLSSDEKYVYYLVDRELYGIDLTEAMKGNASSVPIAQDVPYLGNIDLAADGIVVGESYKGAIFCLKGLEFSLISDRAKAIIGTMGHRYPSYLLDDSRSYLTYLRYNDDGSLSAVCVYLKKTDSQKKLRDNVYTLLDASDPENILAAVYKNAELHEKGLESLGFDHEPISIVEDSIYWIMNMGGHIYLLADGQRIDAPIGLGDIVEYDHGRFSPIAEDIDNDKDTMQYWSKHQGGCRFSLNGTADELVLVDDGSVYTYTLESQRTLRETDDQASVFYYAADGIYVMSFDKKSSIYYIPVKNGKTTNEVQRIAQYGFACGSVNGAFYYLKDNHLEDKYIVGDLYQGDHGTQKLMMNHVYAQNDVHNLELTDEGLAFLYNGIDLRKGLVDFQLYDRKTNFHTMVKSAFYPFASVQENGDAFLYVSVNGELHMRNQYMDRIAALNVRAVWSPLTDYHADNVPLGSRAYRK